MFSWFKFKFKFNVLLECSSFNSCQTDKDSTFQQTRTEKQKMKNVCRKCTALSLYSYYKETQKEKEHHSLSLSGKIIISLHSFNYFSLFFPTWVFIFPLFFQIPKSTSVFKNPKHSFCAIFLTPTNFIWKTTFFSFNTHIILIQLTLLALLTFIQKS